MTPPQAGQSTDVDMSATPKASRRRPTNPAQPQGSRPGPSGPGPQPSGPSRADKGKQPVRTNPVAVQPQPQPKKPVVPFQRMGVPLPINCATKPMRKSYSSVAKSAPSSQPVTVAELARVASRQCRTSLFSQDCRKTSTKAQDSYSQLHYSGSILQADPDHLLWPLCHL